MAWGASGCVALVVLGSTSDSPTSISQDQTDFYLTASTTKAFGITAKAGGLYPGAKRPLRVRVKNPYGFSIRVKKITFKAKVDTAHASCPARSYLRFGLFGKPMKIRTKSSRTRRLVIWLTKRAPNACKGAVFNLKLKGTAAKA